MDLNTDETAPKLVPSEPEKPDTCDSTPDKAKEDPLISAANAARRRRREFQKQIFKWFAYKETHLLTCYTMFLGTPFIVAWDVCVTMPYYYKELNAAAVRHLLLQAFIFINTMGNVVCTMFTDDAKHGNRLVMSAEEKPGWRYCDKCKHYLPPRSHHCKLCDVCVLKRDHHCVFTGTCISFRSHRYYLMVLFHYFIGGIYQFYYQFEYFWLHTANGFFSCGLSVIFPHIAVLFGQIQPYQFVVIAFQLTGFAIITGVAGLLLAHSWGVLHGQTSYEMGHGITTYDCGYLQNIRNTLGTRWYLVWISPTISSPLPGEYGVYQTKNCPYLQKESLDPDHPDQN